MPFTLAHPAAVIPLRRRLGRRGVLSALVIGSLTPDLAYFIPVGLSRTGSHTPSALLWFCLPIGLLAYLLFHLVLKQPLAALLPVALAHRLPERVVRRRLPPASVTAVVLSLLIGAVTHLVWDAFTHPGAPGVRLFPVLQAPVFSLGGYQVAAYKLLQHGSSALGLGLIAWWTVGWMRATPKVTRGAVSAPSARTRAALAGAIAGVAAAVGLAGGLAALPQPVTADGVQRAAVVAAIASLSALGALLFVYSGVWHLRARRVGAGARRELTRAGEAR